ncbi:MAG: oxidoreductase, partial [Clostridiales bacterium]|nr:oxidoreductase [Clostridiales bacterium]
MKQCYMVIDVALCHDCNNCFMACKDEHVANDWPGYTAAQPRHGHRWMNIERRERGQYSRNDIAYLPMPCQHCENAPCIAAGNGAVVRREDGIVMIDMEKAKGNEALAASCPYGAIYWNSEACTPQKCTMCAHLLDDGEWTPKMPRCAHTCPTGSMKFYTVEPAEMDKLICEEDLKAYKAELGTKPHVLYKNLHKYTHNFIAGGVLLDGDCFENA